MEAGCLESGCREYARPSLVDILMYFCVVRLGPTRIEFTLCLPSSRCLMKCVEEGVGVTTDLIGDAPKDVVEDEGCRLAGFLEVSGLPVRTVSIGSNKRAINICCTDQDLVVFPIVLM